MNLETTYEGYNFNEILGQFEPLDNTCEYCQKNKTTSIETNKYLKLYKENDRTNLIVYRSVKYNKFTILIPRCSECYKIHNNIKLYSRILTWLSFFLIFPLGYYFFGGVFGMFVSLISSISVAVYVYSYSENKFLEIKQIDSEWEGAEKVKLVKDFLDDDWTGIPPSA